MSIAPPPTPQQRLELAAMKQGADVVVAGCVGIMMGAPSSDEFITMLGGLPASHVLAGAEGGRDGYWPRVWAMRGLLHIWHPSALEAVLIGLTDDNWRVREMAAKVIANYHVVEASEAASRLQSDEVPGVREAVERALRAIAQYREVEGHPTA